MSDKTIFTLEMTQDAWSKAKTYAMAVTERFVDNKHVYESGESSQMILHKFLWAASSKDAHATTGSNENTAEQTFQTCLQDFLDDGLAGHEHTSTDKISSPMVEAAFITGTLKAIIANKPENPDFIAKLIGLTDKPKMT